VRLRRERSVERLKIIVNLKFVIVIMR